MKKILGYLLILLLSAAPVFGQTALEFNDSIADITDSLYKKGGAWGAVLNESMKSGNYENLKPARVAVLQFIEKKITVLSKQKDISGSEELRKTAISFLEFEKTMITKAFIPFEKFTASSSEGDINTAVENLTKESEKEGEELKKLQAAQAAYAKKNDFRIEGMDEDEEEE